MRILLVVALAVLSLNCVAMTLPRNPYLLLRYGQRYLKKGNYSLSVSCFKKATELGLHSVRLYSDLGRAYYKSKKFKKAIAAFSQVLELDPGEVFALQMRALSRIKCFSGQKAKLDIDTAYLLQPHSGFTCSLYGRYYKGRRLNSRAYYWFKKVLIYDKNYCGYLAAGQAAFKLNYFRQAKEYFLTALVYTRVLKNRQYLIHRAILSFYKQAVKIKRQGRVEIAKVIFQNILKKYPLSKYAKLAKRELQALRYLAELRRM